MKSCETGKILFEQLELKSPSCKNVIFSFSRQCNTMLSNKCIIPICSSIYMLLFSQGIICFDCLYRFYRHFNSVQLIFVTRGKDKEGKLNRKGRYML